MRGEFFERKPKLVSCYHHINTNVSKTSVRYINMEYGKENEDDGHLEELSCHSPKKKKKIKINNLHTSSHTFFLISLQRIVVKSRFIDQA